MFHSRIITHSPGPDQYWIGAADYELTHVFRWLDGEPLKYSRVVTEGGLGQQALEWYHEDFWGDYYVADLNRYICQSTPGLYDAFSTSI